MRKWDAFLFTFAVYAWNDGLRMWEHVAYVQGVLHRQPLNLDIVRSLLSKPKLGFVLIEHQSKFEDPRRVYWRGQNGEFEEYSPKQAEAPGNLSRTPLEHFDYAVFSWQRFFKKWEHECSLVRTEDDKLLRDVVRSLACRPKRPTDTDHRQFVAVEKQTGPRAPALASWMPTQSTQPEFEFWVGSSLSEPRRYQPKQPGRASHGQA